MYTYLHQSENAPFDLYIPYKLNKSTTLGKKFLLILLYKHSDL